MKGVYTGCKKQRKKTIQERRYLTTLRRGKGLVMKIKKWLKIATQISGIIMGFGVSTIPFLTIGWVMYKTNYKDIHIIAVITVFLTTFLEKIIPLYIASIMAVAEPYYQNAFQILSEEFPYFIYGFWYIFISILLSYIFFYLGVLINRSVKGKC